MSHRIVLNYPLPDDYYQMPYATPMETQHSSGSTNSNWSYSSATLYHAYSPSQQHGNVRHTTSTQGISPRPSHNASHRQTPTSHCQGHPQSPSSNSDGDSKEQYCTHRDCLGPKGQPQKFFSRKADVSRHYKSTHEKEFIDCPWPKCQRKGAHGFTRMDHLNEHRRGYHGDKIPKRVNSQDTGERHER